MAFEAFYAPVDGDKVISLDDLMNRLGALGFPCALEPGSEETPWIAFEGLESALLASVDSGRFLGGTLQVVINDDPSAIEGIDAVLREAGYSAGDDS